MTGRKRTVMYLLKNSKFSGVFLLKEKSGHAIMVQKFFKEVYSHD